MSNRSFFDTSSKSVSDRDRRQAIKLPLSFCTTGVVLAFAEAIAIIVLAVGNESLYDLWSSVNASDGGRTWAAGLISAILFCLLMQTQHLYRPASILSRSRALKAVQSWMIAVASILALGFLAHVSTEYSRGAAISFFVSGALILPASCVLARRTLSFLLANNLLLGRRKVLVIGEATNMASQDTVERLRRYGYNVVGCLVIDDSAHATLNKPELVSIARQNNIDEVFLAFDNASYDTVDEIARHLQDLPVPVRLLFGQKLDTLLSLPIRDLGAARSVKLQSGTLQPHAQFLKRSLDLVLSLLGLLMLGPFFVIVGLAIRLDTPGPIIFRQRRAGFNGRVFQIYKFRSMTTLDDGIVVYQAKRGDKRVTRVGKYLRRTSIDELPQLLNVLRGEMSIVGPRPHALSHDDQYTRLISNYALRHHMKPGITGWAQVNGCRGETPALADMERRVHYDIWYIKHWSIFLDLRAISRTVWQIVVPKNVY